MSFLHNFRCAPHIYLNFRCLGHIINLATQALISTRSRSLYYSANNADLDVPDLGEVVRDELGLIRAITVKARSSSQRKTLFLSIQEDRNVRPLQLLLDMKVRWGSTHAMLLRAENRREVCILYFLIESNFLFNRY